MGSGKGCSRALYMYLAVLCLIFHLIIGIVVGKMYNKFTGFRELFAGRSDAMLLASNLKIRPFKTFSVESVSRLQHAQ